MQQISLSSKYHTRTPRYVLQPQDNTLIRLAGPRQEPWEESTEIKNISLTGLAFVANSDLCPIIGELIKIEFDIPGSRKMACYGLVTRLEPSQKSQMLVGVHFQKLELPQRVVLLQGLAQKLKSQLDLQQNSNSPKLSDFFSAYFSNYILSLKMTISFMTWMALCFFMFNFQSS